MIMCCWQNLPTLGEQRCCGAGGAAIQTPALGKRGLFSAKSGRRKTVFVGITCVSQLWQLCFLLLFSPGQSS